MLFDRVALTDERFDDEWIENVDGMIRSEGCLVGRATDHGRQDEMHGDLKVSTAAADDESCQDNEKHNRGGDGPPVIFAPPWVGPPAVAAGRATSIFKVWVYHFSYPR
jgi:hypothetical protein